jgi:hypothetical protein
MMTRVLPFVWQQNLVASLRRARTAHLLVRPKIEAVVEKTVVIKFSQDVRYQGTAALSSTDRVVLVMTSVRTSSK